jgi:hypothetical protein
MKKTLIGVIDKEKKRTAVIIHYNLRNATSPGVSSTLTIPVHSGLCHSSSPARSRWRAWRWSAKASHTQGSSSTRIQRLFVSAPCSVLRLVLPESSLPVNLFLALLLVLHLIMDLTHASLSQVPNAHSARLAVIETSCSWEMRGVHLLRWHTARGTEALLLSMAFLLCSHVCCFATAAI